MIKQKYKASVFIHALVVLTVVLIFVSLFFVIIKSYSLPSNELSRQIKFERNKLITIQQAIAITKLHYSSSFREWPLEHSYFDEVNYTLNSFGNYDMLTLTFAKEHMRDTVSCHFGYANSENTVSLYLKDTGIPLKYASSISIDGTAYLPKNSSKALNDKKQELIPSGKITAKRLESGANFPIDYSTVLFSPSLPENDYNTLSKSDSLIVSFSSPTQTVHEEEWYGLTYLEGNIIVSSFNQLRVYNDQVLKNITLQAPVIRIQSGTVLSGVQLFATDSIILENGVQLLYPSTLVVKGENAVIEVKEDALVEGMLLLSTPTQTPSLRSLTSYISVEEGATVKGIVMSEGGLHLHGKIKGSGYINQIYNLSQSGFELNYWEKGSILNDSLSNHYASPLYIGNQQREIVQWVN